MRDGVTALRDFLRARMSIPVSVLTATEPGRPYALLYPSGDGPIGYDSVHLFEPLSIEIVIYAGDPDTAMEKLDEATEALVELDDKSLPIAGKRLSKLTLGSSRTIQPIAGEPNNYVARLSVRMTVETLRRK